MTTHLDRRWGGGGQDPDEKELREALAELVEQDNEHPDCWLSRDDGWTIAAHQDGIVVLENIETGEGPWHMQEQQDEAILALWRQLQAGDVTGIRSNPWLPGYK